MDLDSTVRTHAQWKTQLRQAISAHTRMDVSTMARDDCCELGQWLHGEAKARFGHLEAHRACVHSHQAFHTEVAKVARAVNAEQFALAENMLGAATPYARASSALGVAFLQLRKAAAV